MAGYSDTPLMATLMVGSFPGGVTVSEDVCNKPAGLARPGRGNYIMSTRIGIAFSPRTKEDDMLINNSDGGDQIGLQRKRN